MKTVRKSTFINKDICVYIVKVIQNVKIKGVHVEILHIPGRNLPFQPCFTSRYLRSVTKVYS